MCKQKFLDQLRKRLSGLPEKDLEEHLAFYGEMIDDRMEEGCTEEEAVRNLGSAEEIAAQILAETPLSRIAKERIKSNRHLKAWEIVLLILGSPIWFSLMVAAASVIFAFYAVLWSLIASVWAVFASVAACSVIVIPSGIPYLFGSGAITGAAILGAGLICAGMAIFLFFGCICATKGMISLTRKILLGVKRMILKKEELS